MDNENIPLDAPLQNKELLHAICLLCDAFKDVNDIWTEARLSDHDETLISFYYPFDKSFDELYLHVLDWTNELINGDSRHK